MARTRTNAVPSPAVEDFRARLDNAVDLIAIIRQIKSFLKLIGQWDRLIDAINDLKNNAPDWVDGVIDSVVGWLEAL